MLIFNPLISLYICYDQYEKKMQRKKSKNYFFPRFRFHGNSGHRAKYNFKGGAGRKTVLTFRYCLLVLCQVCFFFYKCDNYDFNYAVAETTPTEAALPVHSKSSTGN